MALVDSGRAIGAVSRLLQERLSSSLTVNVTIGRPSAAVVANSATLNLFLYQVLVDGQLRNVSLDEGQPAPIWLALGYVLTAFDDTGESDTAAAHDLLGNAIRALSGLNFFTLEGLAANIVEPLCDNPDCLKLSFDDSSPDMIANLIQGSESTEFYRCSIGFRVRPVLVAGAEQPSYSLLVGVDYTNDTIIGRDGVRVPVLPSMGPVLSSVEPPRFEVDTEIEVRGTDLHLQGLTAELGGADLPILSAAPDRLRLSVPAALGDGALVSAGSHPLAVLQALPSGRSRSSNLLIGHLIPRIDTAVEGVMTLTPQGVTGTIDLGGVLMGSADDDVYAALYRDGRVYRLIDRFEEIPPSTNLQTEKRVVIEDATAVPSGAYRLILRVNGEQANGSPLVDVVP